MTTENFVFGESNIVGESNKDNITRPVEVTEENKLSVDIAATKDNAARTAFGLLKTATEGFLQDYRFTQSSVATDFSEITTGIGSYNVANSRLEISTGAQTNSGIQLTSNFIHNYSPGKGQIVKFSIILLDSGIAGNIREWGLYDDNNGIFIRLNGTQYEIVLRSDGVETVIPAASWNGDNTITPDPNGHLWYCQFQWLGVGDFYIYYDGKLVHTINYLGTSTDVSIANPDLPIRFYNSNSTNSTDVNMRVGCASVSTEGLDSLKITDGSKDILFSEDRRLLIQGAGTPLMSQGFDETIDTVSRWTETIVGGATRTQTANTFTMELDVTTAATDSVSLFFNENQLKEVSGSYSDFRIGVKVGSQLEVGNRREWGYLDPSQLNGVFFRYDGPNLYIVTVKDGVENATDITSSKPNENFHLYSIAHLGAGKIIGKIDDNRVFDVSPAGQSRVGSSEKGVFIRMYNTGALGAVPSSSEFHWVRLDDLSGTSVSIVGVDDDSNLRSVKVDALGQLVVKSSTGGAPPATTSVTRTIRGSLSGTNDDFYTITNGKTLVINKFVGFAEVSNRGTLAEIYEDVNGDGLTLIFLRGMVNSGGTTELDTGIEIAGDGTKRILLRVTQLSGGSFESLGLWDGYEQ
ncbi:MAG: hypothetical protein NWE83_04445 [Candidatus Bathyarchaeota archaeon]|nr:hypothetical protein [Candidatus Bathyarchaeota archaeon]